MQLDVKLGSVKEKILPLSLTAVEALSNPFEFRVDFACKSPNLVLADSLGTDMTVTVEHAMGKRYFNGLVAHLALSHRQHLPYFRYEAIVRPWFWFLSHTQDSRIFQGKDVVQIIEAVCSDHASISKVVKKLSGTYVAREYCVQYRESDMDFLTRLMAQEGIYYFFRHSESGHEMVLCDGPRAHTCFKDFERIPYQDSQEDEKHGGCIYKWRSEAQILPTMVQLADFDFLKPKATLMQRDSVPPQHALNQYEVFDYPGAYQIPEVGQHYAKVRVESQQAGFLLASGETTAAGLCNGYTFKSSDLPNEQEDKEYLVRASKTYIGVGNDDWEQPLAFRCGFQVMPAKQVFRPSLDLRVPQIHGSQTAIVVGPKGQPVYTDEYGRVKVLFHWDREGSKSRDDRCSCWVRVSQPWAGNAFGMVNIPRIGDEVVVSFLEGDPGQPLITGRVYNADFRAPYPLPERASITGIRTRSMGSDAKDDANELRFEDDKGKEYVWLQAQKDFHRWVKSNDHETVLADQFIEVKGLRKESIEKTLEQTVAADVKTTYGRDHHHKVAGDWIASAGKAVNVSAGTDVAVTGVNIHVKASANMTLEAGTMLTLKVGGATVVLGSAGVTIDGTLVKINCGGGGGSASAPAKAQAAEKPEADKDPLAGGAQ